MSLADAVIPDIIKKLTGILFVSDGFVFNFGDKYGIMDSGKWFYIFETRNLNGNYS